MPVSTPVAPVALWSPPKRMLLDDHFCGRAWALLLLLPSRSLRRLLPNALAEIPQPGVTPLSPAPSFPTSPLPSRHTCNRGLGRQKQSLMREDSFEGATVSYLSAYNPLRRACSTCLFTYPPSIHPSSVHLFLRPSSHSSSNEHEWNTCSMPDPGLGIGSKTTGMVPVGTPVLGIQWLLTQCLLSKCMTPQMRRCLGGFSTPSCYGL